MHQLANNYKIFLFIQDLRKMGGGGSTSYHIPNQLLSIKDEGGEYRDMNISTIEMT
jgi:hypothetical protein